MVDIRDQLRWFIKDNNLIKSAVARDADMEPCQLSLVLHKKRKLEANELLNICGVIKTTPNELKDYIPRKQSA